MYQAKPHDRPPDYGENTTSRGHRDEFELNLKYGHEIQAWSHRLLMPALGGAEAGAVQGQPSLPRSSKS